MNSEKKRQEKAKKKAAEKAEKMSAAQKEVEAKTQDHQKEEEKEIDPSVSLEIHSLNYKWKPLQACILN